MSGMTTQALLLLQRSDVVALSRNPRPYEGQKLLFIDPGVVDEAVHLKLDLARVDYRGIDTAGHLQARVHAEATARAHRIDQRLTLERERLFGKGQFQGWDMLLFRFFYIRALMARRLGEAADATFGETSVGLLRTEVPQQFYFDSFVSTDLFMGSSPRWRVVGSYDDAYNWTPKARGLSFDFARLEDHLSAQAASAVVHVPTVVDHIAHYRAEIAERFPQYIEVPSAFWDMPLGTQRVPLLPVAELPPAYVNELSLTYRERARHIIEAELRELQLPAHALRLQADLMAETCFVQAVNYQGLKQALRRQKPHFVLTDHDTGVCGPLFTIAEQLGSDITVLPHSSYPAQLLPHSVRVTAVEREGFGTPARTVYNERVATRPVRLRPAPARHERPQARTVCLLLNTLFGHGILHIDFSNTVKFHRALAAMCQRAGVRLIVRLKPNNSTLAIASGSLEIPAETLHRDFERPLADVAAESDVCISYGEPTTACIDFLEAGSFLMHAAEQCWPADYLSAADIINMKTVPSAGGDEILSALERMLADPAHYAQRLQRQATEYGHRLADATSRIFAQDPRAAA